MRKFLTAFLIIPIPLLAHPPDTIEHTFGATNINAFVGNGGLSVGISSKGEITVFKWPSPSFYDHLNYMTAIVPVNAGYHAQDLPHMGAENNMGVFAGIMRGGNLYWLRDLEARQDYLSYDDNIVLTRFDVPSGEVVEETFVHPISDVMVLHYTGGMDGDFLIFYENFAPSIHKIYMLPVADWLYDSNNDFFAFYENDAIYHFTLKNKDEYNLSDIFLRGISERDALVRSLISEWKSKEGVWIAVGGSLQPVAHQIGHDGTTECPYSKGWKEEPLDAYIDSEDGDLSGSSYGGCQVNAAMKFPFNSSLTIYITVGKTYEETRSLLNWAKVVGYEELKRDTMNYWREWIGRAVLPDDDELIPFSKRALINIKASTDRNTGAIVASISVQPPYGEDWPRDGAYLNLALDIAGYHSMVTEHNLFYAKVQRREGLFPFLPGSYDMCYYADGMPGGPIPFEIDETAYIIWTLWNHAKFLPEDEREDYIRKVAHSIELASEALYKECFDEKRKLQCYSNEDDNPQFTQGLIGALTYYLAMNTAGEYWEYKGNREMAQRFRRRAYEIRDGIMNNFYFEDIGIFNADFSAMSLLIWPAEFDADYNRENVINWIKHVVDECLGGNVDGFSYISKGILAIGLTERDVQRDWLEGAIKKMVSISTPGTLIMGETFVVSDGKFENRVSMPHNWEAALTYLSAMALYNPQSFAPLKERIEKPSGGCSTGSGDFSLLIFFVLYVKYLWMRRRS